MRYATFCKLLKSCDFLTASVLAKFVDIARKRALEEAPSAPTLDQLFRKTQAQPPLYWLPLTDQQVAAKRKEKAAPRGGGGPGRPRRRGGQRRRRGKR